MISGVRSCCSFARLLARLRDSIATLHTGKLAKVSKRRIAQTAPHIARLRRLDTHLERHDYLVDGRFTIADIAVATTAEVRVLRELPDDPAVATTAPTTEPSTTATPPTTFPPVLSRSAVQRRKGRR